MPLLCVCVQKRRGTNPKLLMELKTSKIKGCNRQVLYRTAPKRAGGSISPCYLCFSKHCIEITLLVVVSTLDYRVFSTATPGCDPFLICFLFGSLNFWREDSNHSYEYDCFKGPWGSHCDSIWDHIYKT